MGSVEILNQFSYRSGGASFAPHFRDLTFARESEMLDLTIACILTIFACSAAAANGAISIRMTGEENISGVRAIIKDDSTFISIDDVSDRLNIVSKKLSDEVIGLCRDDLCIFVQLDDERDALRDSGLLMINVDLVAQTLSSRVEWLVSGRTLRFVPDDQVALDTVVKVGDLVPDFVLPSITDDRMVSFSSFRGKRVLLFLWASW